MPVVAPSNLSVTYTCDIGTQSGNDYTFTPTTAQYGKHALTAVVKNGSYIIGAFVINVYVDKIVNPWAFKILMLGDSTNDTNDAPYIYPALNTELNTAAITYLGTLGTAPNKTEGRGGYQWASYLGLDPFFIGGVFDVAAYFANNSIATPNIVYIRLGINDVFGYLEAGLTNS